MPPQHRPEDEDFAHHKANWGIWLRLLRYAGAHYKPMLAMAGMAAIMAVLDVLFPLLTRWVINDLADGSPNGPWALRAPDGLWPISKILVGWKLAVASNFALAVLFAAGVYGFIRLGSRISTHFAHDIRRDGFRRLQDLSFSYYDRRSVGWLVSRLTTDCDRLSRIMAWGLLDLAWGTIFLFLLAGVMLALDWRLALVVLLIVPPLAIVSVIFQQKMLHASRKVRRTNSALTASFNEAVAGVTTTKTLVREDDNLAEFQEQTSRMYGESVRNALLHSMYWPIVMAMGAVGAGLAIWAGGGRIAAGTIEIGTLVAFIMLARQFFMPIQELARLLADLQAAQAAAERVVGLMETEPDIQDTPEARERIAAHAASGTEDPALAKDGLPATIGQIGFDHVTFAYDKGETVLEDFCLDVSAGQTVALVGPTGGGKTTIVSLLCRFYEPTEGTVLIDGVDYRHRSLHWLQSNLGIVLQSPQLFSGSIRDNIRFGRLDATDAEIETAARLASADAFIRELPDGYDTSVGQAGGALSTGQKQLISFARAILADPQIFVMDEATSSVDTETEQAIQKAMRAILRGRTSFIIAHRLSTIRSADRILVIREGRIAEEGTHRDLIAARGEYYELYTTQFTREHEEEIFQGGE